MVTRFIVHSKPGGDMESLKGKAPELNLDALHMSG